MSPGKAARRPGRARALVLALGLLVGGCGKTPEALLEEADAAREVGLHDAALERYVKLLEDYPGRFPEVHEKMGDVYAARASGERAAGEDQAAATSTADALRHWELALQADPQSAKLWNKRGAYLMQGGKAEEAMAALSKAVALEPGSHEAHLNLGILHLSGKNLGGALSHLAKAAELAPQEPAVLKTFGVALLRAGQGPQGAAALHQAWRVDRKTMDSPKLFQLLMRAQLWKAAVEVGTEAVEEQSDVDTLLLFAEALAMGGDPGRSRNLLQGLSRTELTPPQRERLQAGLAALSGATRAAPSAPATATTSAP